MARKDWIAAACIVGMSIGYLLPFAVGRGAALTFNAYDLAEWLTLTPAANAETPPLFSALLLRLPLWGISVYAAACAGTAIAGGIRRWLFGMVWLAFVIALLPPLEFANDLGSGNYRQQAGLAIAAVCIGALSLMPRIGRISGVIAAGVVTVGAVWGAARGVELISAYRISLAWGAGAFVCAVFGIAGALALWRRSK